MGVCCSSGDKKMSRNYIKLNELGKTNYSQVTKRVRVGTYQMVAVKKYYKRRCNMERVRNEMSILAEVSHPSVMKMLENEENKQKIYFVLEYIKGRTLRETLVLRRVLEAENVRKVVTKLLDALAYLHSIKICHMDVKTSNVMVSPEFVDVKLIDFGNAKKFPGENPVTHSKSGTARFAAPEFGLSAGCCPFKADVWSLGVVFAHAASPAARRLNIAVFVADMRNSLKEKMEEDCGDEGVVRTVGRMCSYHPSVRPSAEKLNADWSETL